MKSLFLALICFSFLFAVSAQDAPKKNTTDHPITVEKKSDAPAKVLPTATSSTDKVKSDTVSVADTAQFIKIAGRVYAMEAFTKGIPVFLSDTGWGAVLDIINLRDYGKQPATVISGLLQAISQQLPQKK